MSETKLNIQKVYSSCRENVGFQRAGATTVEKLTKDINEIVLILEKDFIMKLLYYCWEVGMCGESWPQLFETKPEDVEIDEKNKTWKYLTDDVDDSGFGRVFEIGGVDSYRKVVPFCRGEKGCVMVIDAENFQHIKNLESLVFHYGTQLHKFPRRP